MYIPVEVAVIMGIFIVVTVGYVGKGLFDLFSSWINDS